MTDHSDNVREVVSRNPLPALLLEVPSDRIVVASPAALDLFSPDDGELIGRSFESLTTDGPSGAVELLVSGRLHGYERVRQLRLSDGSSVPFRTWVRTIGEKVPPRHAFVVCSAVGTRAKEAHLDLPRDFNALIGTTDVNLRIERVHSDVDATVGDEATTRLIGQTLFGIVHPDDAAGLMWALAQATATGKGITLHIHVNSAADRAHLCQMLLLPEDPAPRFAFALISVEDSNGLPDSDVEPSLGEARAFDVVDISCELANLTDGQVPGILELSSRELEVVTRLLAGYRVPAIAKTLFVSQSTVRNQLSSIFRKLNVQSQQELIDLLVHRAGETSSGK